MDIKRTENLNGKYNRYFNTVFIVNQQQCSPFKPTGSSTKFSPSRNAVTSGTDNTYKLIDLPTADE